MQESLPHPSSESYRLEGSKGVALLIHGLTGTPYELRTIADELHYQGFTCIAPLLPGHGEASDSLREVQADAWIASARETFAALPNQKPKIIVGISMGALLATLLAAENEIDALILISPAYVLRPIGQLGVLLSRLGLYHVMPTKTKKLGSDIADPEGKEKSPAYPALAIHSLIEFNKIRKMAIKCIPRVKCPVFAAFGEHDHTVHPLKSLKKLQRFRGSLQYCILPNSFHVLPLDFDRNELITRIVDFCRHV